MPAFVFTVPLLYGPTRLDVFLTERLKGRYSRREIKEMVIQGTVLLNGKPAKSGRPLKEGDSIEGNPTALSALLKEERLKGEPIPLNVVYEDECLIVVDKAAGMVVHPGAGHKKGTLVHALLGRGATLSSVGKEAGRPGIVHRLDKDTSGLMIVAKNNEAHRRLQGQFESRSVTKIYMALVSGRVDFEEGHVCLPLSRDPKIRQKMAVSREEEAKEALTRYWVMRRFKHATFLKVRIFTGRTHQIRVHMAHLGHPVLGDKLYGKKSSDGALRLALHAAKLEFTHPETGKIMKFESPLPGDFEAMIEKQQK